MSAADAERLCTRFVRNEKLEVYGTGKGKPKDIRRRDRWLRSGRRRSGSRSSIVGRKDMHARGGRVVRLHKAVRHVCLAV